MGHDTRVHEMSNAVLLGLHEDQDAIKELKRRGAHPDQTPVKLVNRAKRASAADKSREQKIARAVSHQMHSGDPRKIKG